MKRIAFVTLGWSLAKPITELQMDKAQVAELLKRIGMGDRFDPDKHYYELEMEVGSEALTFLINALEARPDIGYLNRIDRRYTRQELKSADLLIWGPTNQAIEDDYYDLHVDGYQGGIRSSSRRCLTCGSPLEQTRDFQVNKRLMRDKDVSLTYGHEVIVSEQMARLWQEHGLTGYELRPVQHYRKPYQGEPTLYQLLVTNTLPPMAAPPTEFEGRRHCDVCGRTSGFLKHTHWWGKVEYREDTDVYYPRGTLDVVKDFNHTAEYFGELRVAHPMIIVTQRVYRLLREHKVKHWAAVPAYLLE